MFPRGLRRNYDCCGGPDQPDELYPAAGKSRRYIKALIMWCRHSQNILSHHCTSKSSVKLTLYKIISSFVCSLMTSFLFPAQCEKLFELLYRSEWVEVQSLSGQTSVRGGQRSFSTSLPESVAHYLGASPIPLSWRPAVHFYLLSLIGIQH